MIDLKNIFKKLVSKYTSDLEFAEKCWLEIIANYSGQDRHYHNLDHLRNMFAQLNFVSDKINNLDLISFSIFYHDVIYNATKSDNEEQSAIFAVERLKLFGLDDNEIAICNAQILATKGHAQSEYDDTNYLVDIDLSILGSSNEEYEKYSEQIRSEYIAFPYSQYKIGRKLVIEKFLSLKQIFKTDFFFDKYEKQARINLENELVWYSINFEDF